MLIAVSREKYETFQWPLLWADLKRMAEQGEEGVTLDPMGVISAKLSGRTGEAIFYEGPYGIVKGHACLREKNF